MHAPFGAQPGRETEGGVKSPWWSSPPTTGRGWWGRRGSRLWEKRSAYQHHSFVICCIIYLYLYTGIVLAIAIYSSKNYQGFTVLMFVEDDMFLFIRCGGRQWLCDIIVCTDYWLLTDCTTHGAESREMLVSAQWTQHNIWGSPDLKDCRVTFIDCL